MSLFCLILALALALTSLPIPAGAVTQEEIDKLKEEVKELDKEKEILTAQALNEGKPAQIVEKMVVGRINKYYKDVCLMDQQFVKDPDLSIKQVLANVNKANGLNLSVKRFVRFEMGEGLEKRQDNFVDEVMSQIK